MDDVPINEKEAKTNIIRIKTPEHKNKFYRQILIFFIYSIKTILYSIRYRNSFDQVFVTSSRFGTALLGYFISLFLNKPLYLDIRDIFSDSLIALNKLDNVFGKIIIFIIKKMENRVFTKADWINFVSPGFFDNFKNSKELKPFLFTNGIDTVFIDNYYNFISKQKHKISKKYKIIYTGNIGFGQGIEKIIIPIAQYFKDRIDINIFGDGSSVDLLISKIKSNRLKNINFSPPVNRRELIHFYNQSDILFLHLNDVPAFTKVIPSKIFEYATFNKPILAGVEGTAKWFLNKHLKNVKIFSPNDSKAAIKHIEYLISNNSEPFDNKKFIKKFDRRSISSALVQSVLKINKELNN